MVHVQTQHKEVILIGATALLILALLPLMALAALTLRGLLLVAALAAALGALAVYRLSPKFREWFTAQTEPLIQYKGLKLATDVSFHPSHSWARLEGDVWVGADDLVQAALGPVDDVELPPRGLHVTRGQPLFRLRRGHRVVEVRSPVSGTVVDANPELRSRPELINKDPFAQGWAVRLHSDDPRRDRSGLLRGRKARDWFRAAADRVVGGAPDRATAPSASAGGAVAEQIYRCIDDDTWRQLTETLFTAPPEQVHRN
ncbi:MAG: hypothetical protein C4547_08775 [Phycisphaerales bacterium]|nr:MAG: hypothetical protein C4547_08775 [Phycisphaerales bacterium]